MRTHALQKCSKLCNAHVQSSIYAASYIIPAIRSLTPMYINVQWLRYCAADWLTYTDNRYLHHSNFTYSCAVHIRPYSLYCVALHQCKSTWISNPSTPMRWGVKNPWRPKNQKSNMHRAAQKYLEWVSWSVMMIVIGMCRSQVVFRVLSAALQPDSINLVNLLWHTSG